MIFHQVVICDCWPTSVKVCFVNTIERVPASPKGDFEARGRRLKTLPKHKKCQQKYISGNFEIVAERRRRGRRLRRGTGRFWVRGRRHDDAAASTSGLRTRSVTMTHLFSKLS